MAGEILDDCTLSAALWKEHLDIIADGKAWIWIQSGLFETESALSLPHSPCPQKHNVKTSTEVILQFGPFVATKINVFATDILVHQYLEWKCFSVSNVAILEELMLKLCSSFCPHWLTNVAQQWHADGKKATNYGIFTIIFFFFFFVRLCVQRGTWMGFSHRKEIGSDFKTIEL